jgi:hypothetical protein
VISAGGMYPIAFDVLDASGVLTHAASVTLTITLPDGTTATPAITDTAVPGKYRLSYQTTIPGRYTAHAVTTGPVTSWDDTFNVRAFASIIGLGEAKAHLSGGPAAAWTGDDDELLNFLAAVTEVIESKVGPCVRRTVTQRAAAQGGPQIVLTQAPVISVTSVTSVWAGGPTWTGNSLVLDTDAGIVTTQLGAVPFYYGPWDVVHTVGRAVIPERYQHAAKELLRHLWDTQRGELEAGPLSASSGETFTTSAGWAFSIPNRVLEMLTDDMTPAI